MFSISENLSPEAVKAYPGFLTQVRAALRPLGREVWVTAPFDDRDWDLKSIQAATRHRGADGL